MSKLQPDEALYSLLCKYLLNEADAVERRWVETWQKEDVANGEVLSAIRKMLDVEAPVVAYPGLDTETSWERLKRQITGADEAVVKQDKAAAHSPSVQNEAVRHAPHEPAMHRGSQQNEAAQHEPGIHPAAERNAAAQHALDRDAAIIHPPLEPAIHPLPRKRYPALRIAAAVAVLAGLAFWFSTQRGGAPVTFSGAQQAALEDGSQVIMEPDAQMTLSDDFGDKERRVVFSGKAVFDIKQDPQAPFVVMLGKTEIKVLGTRFMVDFHPDGNELTVFVSNGRIMVSDPEKAESVVLSEGMILKRSEPQLPFEVAAHVKDIGKRSLVFRDVPLQDVLQTLKAVYGITVTVADTALLQKEVTTNFENEPIDNIMATIAFMTNTQVEKTGQQGFSIR